MTVTDLTAAGAFAWPVGTGTTEDGTTLVRTRGQFSWALHNIGTVLDGFRQMAVGIGIATEEAFTVGGTPSLPSPLADANWDGWLWHSFTANLMGFSTTEVGQSVMEAGRIEIDSKAMRKFEDGMVVFGSVELGVETGVAVVRVAAETRLLVKLP